MDAYALLPVTPVRVELTLERVRASWIAGIANGVVIPIRAYDDHLRDPSLFDAS